MSEKVECHKCGGHISIDAVKSHIQICHLVSITHSKFANASTSQEILSDEIARLRNFSDGIMTAATKQEQYFLDGQNPPVRTGRHIIGHWTAPGLENPEQETQNQSKKFSPRRIGEWANNRLKRND